MGKHEFTKQITALLIILFFILEPISTFAFLGAADDVHDAVTNAGVGVDAGTNSAQTVMVSKDQAIKALEDVGAAIASQLLNKLTESTVNWINSGFEENPQFVENTGSFFKNLADVEVKGVIDQIGYDAKNFPFGKGVAVSLIKEYVSGQGDLKDKTVFTLDKVIGPNYKDFSTDFSKGGWPGLAAIIGNPANTPLGQYNIAKSELSNKINTVTQKVDKELTRGQGFLDQKVCVKRKPGKNVGKAEQDAANQSAANQALANQAAQGGNSGTTQAAQGGTSNPRSAQGGTSSSGQAAQGGNSNSGQAAQGGTSNPRATAGTSNPSFWSSITDVDEKDCDQYKSMSPGSVVEASLNKAIGSKTDNVALSSVIGSLSSSIGAITNALVNTMVSKGLGALSSKGKQAPATNEQEWSYNGYTLTPKPKNAAGGFDYSQNRVVDLEEILITGAPDQTQVITNPTTGEPEIKVLTRKKTVLESTKTVKENYRKITELIDGNKQKNIPSLSEKLKQLDYCIPGPDYGWELRLSRGFGRAEKFLNKKLTSKSDKKANKAQAALDKLARAEKKIERDIKFNMLEHNIPSYPQLVDKVARSRRFSLKAKEYYDKYLTFTATTAMLESIKKEYLKIKTNPNSTTVQLGDLLQQYAGIEEDVANDFNLAQSIKDYNTLYQDYTDLSDELSTCRTEKRVGGTSFTLPNGTTANSYDDQGEYSEDAVPSEDLADITILDVGTGLQMDMKFKTELGTSSGHALRALSGDDTDQSNLVYSIMKAYSTNTRLTDMLGSGLTGDTLFDAVKNYVENDVDDAGLLPVKITNETKFYCWDQLAKTNTSNYWRNRDVNLTCDKFYHADNSDYEIEKEYLP